MGWFRPTSPTRHDDPDVRLMLAFQEGDTAAFETLMSRYYGRVLNFVARLTGRPDAAEDLAQEVFLRVYRSRGRYRPQARFRTWLFTIARNLALNWLRGAARRAPAAARGDAGAPASEPADEVTPGAEERLQQRERRQAVRRAIDALPPNQRSAVLLRRFEQFSYAEIAEALGISEPAVKSLLSRAKQNLKQALQPLLEER